MYGENKSPFPRDDMGLEIVLSGRPSSTKEQNLLKVLGKSFRCQGTATSKQGLVSFTLSLLAQHRRNLNRQVTY